MDGISIRFFEVMFVICGEGLARQDTTEIYTNTNPCKHPSKLSLEHLIPTTFKFEASIESISVLGARDRGCTR